MRGLCHRHVHPIFARTGAPVPHTCLLTTNMSALAACLRVLSRAPKPSPRAPVRAFHSPFVVLSPSNRLTTPSPSTVPPIYEKEDDSSSEPHLSSSGTRTYVVSEPDPSNTPYHVPSGAYPASASYVNYNSTATTNPKTPYHAASSSIPHPHTTHTTFQHETSVGGSAAVRSAEDPGEIGRTVGNNHKENLIQARTKSGKF